MICPRCKDEHRTSVVTMIGSRVALVHVPVMYDEQGERIAVAAPSRTDYQCSNGHRFSIGSLA